MSQRVRAEGDEPEVRERRVGHQALHVALTDGQQGTVEDADHGKRQHQRGEVARGIGEKRDAVADQPEGADLVEHADQQHRAADRSFGTGIGKPGVERKERRLDGEGEEEAEEEQLLDAPGDRHAAQGHEVERAGARAWSTTTYRPMTAASMMRPPKRLYSKNFTDA